MNWNASKEEIEQINNICKRAFVKSVKKLYRTITDLQMDITATHLNGCPLDLKKLFEFDDFNFYHDIYGIYGNIDRSTGELKNHFLPRCAR